MAGVAPNLSMKVELVFSCSHIPSLDVFSKSDCFVIVSSKNSAGAYLRLGQTEVINNNNDPTFTTQIPVDYRFEEVQTLKFEVWDFDVATAHDFVGFVEVPLGRIMGSRGGVFSAPLVGRGGSITIRGLPVKDVNETLRIQFQGVKLAAKDSGFMGIGGKSDPYLKILRILPDGTKLTVFQNTPISRNLNPVWPSVDLHTTEIVGGDVNSPIQVEVWDWDATSAHDLIGQTAVTSIKGLIDAAASRRSLPLVEPAKVGKRGYSDSGTVVVASATLFKIPSFLEYLSGGLQLNMVAAVDFTGSNGNPADPGSLHYGGGRGVPTKYLEAIVATGSVLLEYDSDKSVPYFGFGGALPDRTTSHCFAMNGNPAMPEVRGIEGMVAAYWQALSVIGLSGPTYFAPIIRKTMELASASPCTQASQKYTVLLLLTDGQFNDEVETISAIVDASYLPISIVIVGIGMADFSPMEMLDCDKGLLRSATKTAARDIVQFVPFRDYRGPYAGEELAKAVLKEIPGQVSKYFTSCGISPNPVPEVAFAPPSASFAPPPGVGGMPGGGAGVAAIAHGVGHVAL